MTKWVTGWLPVGKNMARWGFWATPNCPECQFPNETPSHVLHCPAPARVQLLFDRVAQLEQLLYACKLSSPAISIVLQVLFPQAYPAILREPEELIEIRHWHRLFNQFPNAWGFLHNSWKVVMARYPKPNAPFKHSPRRWLAAILSQLWNIAWDLWGYRNGILHTADQSRAREVLLLQAMVEYQRHTQGLPPSEWYWFDDSLTTLLQKTEEYLHAWLLTIKALQQRHHD